MKTPKGEGLAVLVIDYGPDHDLWWTVIVNKGEHAGEVWTYPNPQVRGVDNVTIGRRVTPPVVSTPADEVLAGGGRWGVDRGAKGSPETPLVAPLPRG